MVTRRVTIKRFGLPWFLSPLRGDGKQSWYPKRRKRRDTKSFAYKRKDNNSYPKFSVLSEGGIKASHTSCEAFFVKPRKDTCSAQPSKPSSFVFTT